jgi:hypothetical protein
VERRAKRENSSLVTEVLEARIGCERDGGRASNERGMGSRRGANVLAEGAELRRAIDETEAVWWIVWELEEGKLDFEAGGAAGRSAGVLVEGAELRWPIEGVTWRTWLDTGLVRRWFALGLSLHLRSPSSGSSKMRVCEGIVHGREARTGSCFAVRSEGRGSSEQRVIK